MKFALVTVISLMVLATSTSSTTDGKVARQVPPYHWPAMNPWYQYQGYPAELQQHHQSPYFKNNAEKRFLLPVRGTSTVTTTSTFTSIKTCTVSTTACSGRRRREAIAEMLKSEQQQQFADISPSAVHSVEPTTPSESQRTDREAYGSYYIPHSSMSGYGYADFEGSPYYNYQPSYYNKYPSNNGYLPGAGARFFGDVFEAVFSNRFTHTTTVTAFTVSTSTSTPGCSIAGSIPQCPASG